MNKVVAGFVLGLVVACAGAQWPQPETNESGIELYNKCMESYYSCKADLDEALNLLDSLNSACN